MASHSHDGKPCQGHGQPGHSNHHLPPGHSHSSGGGGHQGHSHSHSHGGVPCAGHGGSVPGSMPQQDQEYHKQVEAHMKWIVQDYQSALQALNISSEPTIRAQSRFIAIAISELLRLGPKPDTVSLPPSHPFMRQEEERVVGPIGVFIDEKVMQILIKCCGRASVNVVEWIKDPRGQPHLKDFEYDTMIYLECILDLLYSLYDDFQEAPSNEEEEEGKEKELVLKNKAILDQFLENGEGIKLLKSIPIGHTLPPLNPDIKELRMAIVTLLKSFQVFLCKCDREECENVEEKQGEFKSCAKCRIDVYCSRECQVAAWGTHKLVCGKIIRPALHNPTEGSKQASAKVHHGI